MNNIDLTLRREFYKNPSRRDLYDDTNRYNDSLGSEDQRRAKLAILNYDEFKSGLFAFSISYSEHHDFFKEDKKIGWEEYDNHENILKITGILTSTLKMEYDAGYGNEDRCDCCGGFRSHILNSEKFGICDSCEKGYRFRNNEFWERKQDFIIEMWVD